MRIFKNCNWWIISWDSLWPLLLHLLWARGPPIPMTIENYHQLYTLKVPSMYETFIWWRSIDYHQLGLSISRGFTVWKPHDSTWWKPDNTRNHYLFIRSTKLMTMVRWKLICGQIFSSVGHDVRDWIIISPMDVEFVDFLSHRVFSFIRQRVFRWLKMLCSPVSNWFYE